MCLGLKHHLARYKITNELGGKPVRNTPFLGKLVQQFKVIEIRLLQSKAAVKDTKDGTELQAAIADLTVTVQAAAAVVGQSLLQDARHYLSELSPAAKVLGQLVLALLPPVAHLQQASVVPDIHEPETAQVPVAVHPTTDCYVFSSV